MQIVLALKPAVACAGRNSKARMWHHNQPRCKVLSGVEQQEASPGLAAQRKEDRRRAEDWAGSEKEKAEQEKICAKT